MDQLLQRFVIVLVVLSVLRRIGSCLLTKVYQFQHLKPLPGPPPGRIPLLGVLPAMLEHMTDYYDWIASLFQTYGDTLQFPISLFMDATIVTNNRENVRHVLISNFNNYVKPSVIRDNFCDFLGQGIFTISHAHTKDKGELWKLQRKLITRVFSANRFRHYATDVFQVHAQVLLAKLEESAKHASTETLDLQDEFLHFTSRCTFHLGFGEQFSDQINHEKFQRVYHRVSELCVTRFMMPWLRWLRYLMPSEYEIRRGVEYIDQVAYGILAERSHDSPKELGDKHDMLSLFLKRKEDGDDADLSPRLLRDIILTIVGTGSDSTSCLITWVVHFINQYAHIRHNVVAEIDAKLDADEPLTYDNLKKMTYLDCVVYETLRLRPPSPLNMKCAAQDDVFPDGTRVPAGTHVIYAPYAMGRDTKAWPEPLEFRPERWADVQSRPSAAEFPVFQAGPRACPGQAIALMETKLVVCLIFQRFVLENQNPSDPTYDLNMALRMKGGLPVKVLKRTHSLE